MSKKLIIISIVAVIIIIGTTVGVLYAIKPPTKTETDEQSSAPQGGPVYVVDTSKDYGACAQLEKQIVKDALGDVADNLQGPDNAGRAGRVQTIEGGPEGTVSMDSQTCVYGFVSGGTVQNGFNADNGFSVVASQLEAQKDHDQLLKNYQEDVFFESIDGIEDGAFYKAVTGKGYDISTFELVVIDGLKAYTYTINQPAKKTTFTIESAKTALQKIASSLDE